MNLVFREKIMNILEEIKDMEDMEISAVQNEWYFKCQMEDERTDAFDGVSLIEWTDDDRIRLLKEFGCNINNYDPYQYGDTPQFNDEKVGWF